MERTEGSVGTNPKIYTIIEFKAQWKDEVRCD